MLKNLDPEEYDIACIQEPYLNPVNLANASNLRRFWDVIYPSNHHAEPNRSQTIILINRRLSKNAWHAVQINSPNVMAIELTSASGKVRIYNVYNPCNDNDTIIFLERHMLSEQRLRDSNTNIAEGENIIWMGDFNRHHPMWEPSSNTHLFTAANLDAAGMLINLLAIYNLVQVLPKGIATLEASNTKNLTRPDNVFCSADLMQAFASCTVEYHLRPIITDHFPIISSLEFHPEIATSAPKPNYRETDWESFNETLAARLDAIPPAQELTSRIQFDEAFTNLTEAISQTINERVPKTKPSPYAKRWWSKDLDQERQRVHKLGKKARAKIARRRDPIHEEYRVARNRFSESIKKAKEEHWKDWLDNMKPTDVWTFHNYATSSPTDHYHTRISTLKDPAAPNQSSEPQDNARKSELLYETFFRRPPDNEHVDANYIYPPPICDFELITDRQIYQAISKLSPHKAPGPNGVSNCVFIKCASLLVPYMAPIFRATFSLEIYPDEWKKSTTVVLRKPSRPDYSLPKAYRPITLLDTMAKILSSCVADELTYIAEQHNLLAPTHFGGRPGRTTTDSIHLLTKFITDAWASKEGFVSLLFLDVKAAFPSVVVNKLLHNLRAAGIPQEYVNWYKRRLDNRTTSLTFDDYQSHSFNVINGIDQGCPLSPIAFIFYNSPLLKVAHPSPRKGELSLGFIDDVALAAKANSYEAANEKLRQMMERPGGALDWSREHNAEFELDKTALLCLSRIRIPDPTNPRKSIPAPRPPIVIQEHIIQPSASAKFLGVIIDENLNFKEHAAHALAKGMKYTLACNRMIKPTKGIRGQLMKRLYEGVVIPKMMYAADIWCAGLVAKGRGRRTNSRGARGFMSQMARVQRMATLLITGGMRSSATDILDAHANILPIQQTLRKLCFRSILRIATQPATHPLAKGAQAAFNYCEKRQFKGRKRHPSPLHKLMNEFQVNPAKMEKILPTRHYPKWEADVETHIAHSAEEAIIEDEEATEDWRVYSDGSAVEEGVGAAAVLMRGEEEVMERRFYLGTREEHTVYEGEIVGMILAVHLLREAGAGGTMALGVDNQAAIKATGAFNSQPGHYLMDLFHDDLRKLLPENDGRKLVIRWSPGHVDIPGNEAADKRAKEAARGESSAGPSLPLSLQSRLKLPITLPTSKSATRQHFQGKLKEEATQVMRASPRHTHLQSIDPSAPSKHYASITATLPRRHSSLLFQFRSGHAPLNKHLFRIARAQTAICPNCNDAQESVHHFLIKCPAYTRQRNLLRHKLGVRANHVKNLLNDPKCVKPMLEFVARTRRLETVFGDVSPPKDKDEG